MAFWQTIVTGAAGAAIGAYINNRGWRARFDAEDSRRDHDEAIKVLDKLCRSFESRYYQQIDFWRRLRDDSVTSDNADALKSAILTWMSEFSSNKAGIRVYFGREKSIEFETEVHRFLQMPAEYMLRTHKLGFARLSTPDQYEHHSVPDLHESCRRNFYIFTRELTEAIEAGDIGSRRRRKSPTATAYDAKSSFYLAQRLVGLKD